MRYSPTLQTLGIVIKAFLLLPCFQRLSNLGLKTFPCLLFWYRPCILAFYFDTNLAFYLMRLPLYIHHIFNLWRFRAPNILKHLVLLALLFLLSSFNKNPKTCMKNRFNKRDEVWGLVVTKGCSLIELSLKKRPMEFRVLRRLQRGHVQ